MPLADCVRVRTCVSPAVAHLATTTPCVVRRKAVSEPIRNGNSKNMDALMLGFAASSAMTGVAVLVAPKTAFRWYGVDVDDKVTFPTVCYGASLLGEASLQYAAARAPAVFLPGALVFMAPYKLASAAALIWAGMRGHLPRRPALFLAAQWLSPLVMIAGVVVYEWESAAAFVQAEDA